uniref:hypothetical protein n=1 Tax=Paenirhodobacter enshiensis TaxID=1105367 RepID=UPI003FA202A1
GKEDRADIAAGIELHAKPGDAVKAGEPVLTLHTSEPAKFERAHEALEGGTTWAPEGTAPSPRRPIVIDRIA